MLAGMETVNTKQDKNALQVFKKESMAELCHYQVCASQPEVNWTYWKNNQEKWGILIGALLQHPLRIARAFLKTMDVSDS